MSDDELTITEQNALKWAMFLVAFDKIRADQYLDAERMWVKMSEWIGLVR